MELHAGNIRLVVDKATGAIVRIEDRVTGLVHVPSNPDKLLFRITVPRGTWSSRYVDNHFAPPRILKHTNSEIVFKWDNLPAEDGPTGVSVEVCLHALPDAGEVRFTIDVANNGPDRLTEVCFPIIGGWTGIGGKGADEFVLGGHGSLDPHSFPRQTGMTYATLFQKDRQEYPVGLYAPWVDLSGPGGGISMVHYMEAPQNITFFEHNEVGHEPGLRLAFGWRTPCVIGSGEKWTSAPVGISVHDSDWHATADRYIEWMETWFRPPPSKRSLREMIGFQNVFLRGFDGSPIRTLDAIPQIAADGRQYGVEHLCIWDELTLGNYERMDTRVILEYSPEEKEVIRRGLRQAREEGTNVNALVNFRLFPANPHFIEKYGLDALRLLDGSLYTENYSATHHFPGGWTHDRGPNCCISSSFAKSYRERVLRWTQEYMDLGYVSMFYDQPFETKPDYGRIADGCRPEDTYAAVVSLVAEVRQMLHRNNPDAYIIGEMCEAFMAQHIDLWMSWYTEVSHALHAAYSIPQTMHSWVVDNNAAQASRAFAIGMYLCLCTRGNEGTLADVPEFGEHVSRLAALRRQCADRTVYGRFRDNQGIRVKSDGGAEAYAFDSAEGPAVIVTSPEESSSVTVEVDRDQFTNPGKPEEGRIVRLDGSEEVAAGDTRRFELAANDVAVWLL